MDFDPSIQKAEVGRFLKFKASQEYILKPCLKIKKKKRKEKERKKRKEKEKPSGKTSGVGDVNFKTGDVA